ncbi:MAG: Fur family transcriptional regulator [Dehalococcoidia bacterium]
MVESDSEARLATAGHRLTGPRREVLDAVRRLPGPFTVEELAAKTPAVGRATVFRTVKLLQEAEVICRLVLEDGGIRYELSRGGHHHHLICRECGVVTDFSDPELDALIERNAQSARFALSGHSLELYGLCPACR